MITKPIHKIGLTVVALLLPITSARADQIAWDNGSGTTGVGQWNTGTNWFNTTTLTNSNTPPAPADDLRLGRFNNATLGSGTSGFPSGAAYTIVLGGSRTVNSLLLDHAFGGLLQLGASGTNDPLTLASGTITRHTSTTSNSVLRAPIVLGANAIWTLNGSGETQIDGASSITGPTFTLSKRGSGILRLGVITNNVSNLILEEGVTRFTRTVALGNGNLLWSSTLGNTRLNSDSGTIDVNRNIVFSGPSAVARQFEFSLDDSNNNSTFNDAVGNVTLSGALTGTLGGLNGAEFRLKANSQRAPSAYVIISGNSNTYSGGITRILPAPPINGTSGAGGETAIDRAPDARVILTNTSGSAFGSTNVVLDSATSSGTSSVAGAKTRAYLGGTGRLSGSVSIGENINSNFSGSVIANSAGAGIIAPGGASSSFTGTGTLSTGSVTLNADSAFRAELSGTSAGSFDQLNVTGGVNLGGAALELSSSFAPAGNTSFPIVQNDGIDAVVGTFAGLPQNALVTAAGNSFTIKYNGGDGNDVVLTATGPVATMGAIISEFRFRGLTSADEYVEIFNTTGAPLNVSGWFIRTNTGTASSAGYQPATLPAGTVIPALGHFLFTGTGYSLGAYSNYGGDASTGSLFPTQTPVSIGADAADDSGVALYNAAGEVQDAAGFATSVETPILLREGTGLPMAPDINGTATSQHAFMRSFNGALPKDTGNNAADFVLVSSNGASVPSNAGPIPAQLGAPNPESLSSPVNVNSQVVITLLQPEAGLNNAPNRLRTGSGNGGTLLLRRTIRNTGSQPLSRVRLLMTRITSQGSPTGIVPGTQADVRLISSGNESIALPNRDTNGVIIPAGQDGAGTTLTPVYAALLEAPSNATSTSGTPVVTGGGGGLGSSVVFDLTFPTPLLPNTSANYGFNLQVATGGTYLVAFNVLAVTQAPAN